MNHTRHQLDLNMQRRQFLGQSGISAGALALNSLLADESLGAAPTASALAFPKRAHFAPRAKNVIFLFMAGAPSQLDLFEPKPEMKALHGEPVPGSFLEGLDDALIRGSARIFASPRSFRQYGESGMHFSDFIPNIAECAEKLCMVRSVHTDISNHHPAQLFMNCGVPRFGLPSMGSWISYGLGSESQNLPGFIVMLSRNGSGDLGGPALWDSAFLPAMHRGVTLRNSGDPILHLKNPGGVTTQLQSKRLNSIVRLNELRFKKQMDPEIQQRIAAYEMAFRMQVAAPELLDFKDESRATLQQYGIDDETSSAFGTNCLLARRMVERGVRFVQLYHYTWDDHAALNKKLKENCDMTQKGGGALINDLDQRGLLDETLVVWGGEFGRTPMNEVRRGINAGNEGRDHHPFAFTMLMTGGGIKRDFVYGKTDDIGYSPIENPVHVHDIQATMLHCLGLDHEQLTYHYRGRDFRLTDVAGNVLHDILT